MKPNNPDGSKIPSFDISRRGFLKGAGALATAPLLLESLSQARPAAEAGLQRVGPDDAPCELRINGKTHSLKIDSRLTLLDVLRDKLDLTGTKEICSRGSCGGCNVLMNGRTVNACMTFALDAEGAEIVTIEGLGQGDKLDVVQQKFVEYDAQQCGYCTPGLVMSVRGLLNQNPKPTLSDVRQACSGNICRCGTYPKVFEAALAAAGVDVPVGNIADNKDKAYENKLGRVDGPAKVTGKAKYAADVNLPNMAYACIIYCPYGRARLKSFNEAAAKKVKGVLDIKVNEKKEYAYCGQPTGHICAENRQALADAIAALKLEWEILTPATDPVAEHERADGPIPPPLDKAKPAGRNKKSSGDPAKIFDEAQKVVERTYSTQVQTHCALEPHAAVADFRGESADIWCSTQATGAIHGQAAGQFELDRNKVTAHCEYNGGGFGAKFGLDLEGSTAIKLSKKLNRPVKIVNSRKREHLDTGCRPGSIQYMKMALDGDGKPTGGYVYVAGITGPGGGGDARNPGRYNLGDVVRSSTDIKLSIGDVRAMRAPGHPQGQYAVESMVDELAEAAGVDPLEYRKRIDPNETRKKMYAVGAERIGWKTRPAPNGHGEGRLRRGVGMGVADWGNGEGNARISISVFKDGTLKVMSGTQDIGTGTRTVLADVVAHHLGIERRMIIAEIGLSDYPPGPPSGGSTVTRTIVPAIHDAAEKARDELKKVSGQDFTDTASWIAACKKMPEESFSVVGSFNKEYWGKGDSEAVQFAEVEVDIETGVVNVKKVVALQACGQAINRLTVENQIIGGVIQGISFALFEDKILDPKTGAMVNPNMEMYKLLGPKDCPEIIPIIWAEGKNLGARSIGEPPVVPTAGAVANAIANAIGARVRSLPITPAKVLAALAERGGVA